MCAIEKNKTQTKPNKIKQKHVLLSLVYILCLTGGVLTKIRSDYCWPSLSLCHFPLSSSQCCQMLPVSSPPSLFDVFAFHGPTPSGFPSAFLTILFSSVSSVYLPLRTFPSMWGSLKGLSQVLRIFLHFPFGRLCLEFPFASMGSQIYTVHLDFFLELQIYI